MKSEPGSPDGVGSSGPGGAAETNDEDKHTRLTRNLNELLQELRVMQTGVQIITGFLLTIPFTARFESLDQTQKWVYLAVLMASVVATALIVAPVAFHRTLFRRGEREWIVEATNRSARYGLAALAATMTGAVWLVFDVVVGAPVSHVVSAVSAVLFVALWSVIPFASRRRFR